MDHSERAEEYLELLYVLEEQGLGLVRIRRVSKELGISAPSAVQMLKRLTADGLVEYHKREGVRLTKAGRDAARAIVRNHRLIETLMKKTLGKDVDETVVCGLEHHMSEEFANAICTLLGHPSTCPHGNTVPSGDCCVENQQ